MGSEVTPRSRPPGPTDPATEDALSAFFASRQDVAFAALFGAAALLTGRLLAEDLRDFVEDYIAIERRSEQAEKA